jgi:hypothetical protein
LLAEGAWGVRAGLFMGIYESTKQPVSAAYYW